MATLVEEQRTEVYTPEAEAGPDLGARARGVTVGGTLAIVIVIGAILARFYALDMHPLSGLEAERALLALRYVRGQPAELTGFSPLLANLNLLVFFLAGANDFWARLVPALFGVVLAALPMLRFRNRLGTGGALAASVLIALSPTLVLLSRSVAPAMLSAVASLVFVSAAFDFVDEGQQRDLLVAAGVLAVALTAGPGTYTMLLFLLVFGFGVWLHQRSAADVSAEDVSTEGAGRHPLRATVTTVRNDRQLLLQAGAVFLATFAVAATGFLVNFGGLQAALNLFVEWLRSFSLTSDYPFWYYAGVLVLYEPVILIFGAVGAAGALYRRDAFGLFLVVWAFGGFVLYTLIGATVATLVVPILLPLALLAGRGVAAVLRFSGADEALQGLLVAAFVIPLMVYAGVQIAFYAEPGTATQSLNLLLALGAAVLAMLIAVVFASSRFGMGWRLATVGRGIGVTMLGLTLILNLHVGGHLNFLEHEPVRELLLTEPTSSDMREMVLVLRTLSQDRVGDTVNIPITVDGRVAPTVAWYLNDFENVNVVDAVKQPPGTPIVILPATDEMPAIGDQYVGQGFRLASNWRLAGLSGSDFVRWYFYREGPAVSYDELIVFVER